METDALPLEGIDRELAALIGQLTAPSPGERPTAIVALERLRLAMQRHLQCFLGVASLNVSTDTPRLTPPRDPRFAGGFRPGLYRQSPKS